MSKTRTTKPVDKANIVTESMHRDRVHANYTRIFESAKAYYEKSSATLKPAQFIRNTQRRLMSAGMTEKGASLLAVQVTA